MMPQTGDLSYVKWRTLEFNSLLSSALKFSAECQNLHGRRFYTCGIMLSNFLRNANHYSPMVGEMPMPAKVKFARGMPNTARQRYRTQSQAITDNFVVVVVQKYSIFLASMYRQPFLYSNFFLQGTMY
jgi:hypothetical protein